MSHSRQPHHSPRLRQEEERRMEPKQKDHATKSSIPRTVVFFATKQQCMDARDALRSIWPDSPDQVDTFHGSTSPEQRLNLLGKFKKGLIRVLCCTKATGLGCDIPDIQYSIIYNCVDTMVDLCQKGGRAARGRQVTGRVIWLAPLDAFGPSDIREKKSGFASHIPEPHSLHEESVPIQSRSLCHPLTTPPTPSPSSTNPSIASPAPASHSSILLRFLTFRCVRAIQEVYFRPDLERYMAEHHSGIWEKVPRFTCHLPAYRCCSASEASHLSLVQARGMIGQGTEVWVENQKIKVQRLKPLPSPEEAILRHAAVKAAFKSSRRRGIAMSSPGGLRNGEMAQVFSQLKAPEEFEHASLKGGIVLDDTWEALPELFDAGVAAVGEKRSRRAMEKVRAENLLLELAKDDPT
ncbi:hypothetical protein D1P53_004421 [Cryptococcus gattii VGV]|nr:hypothetical protein D1P53_004421 [Cryptococcus gattii VGV]